MEHYGKEKNIYHGVAIPYIIMVLLPALMFIMFFSIFTYWTEHPREIVVYMSLAFSTLVAVLFDISCIIAGLVHDNFIFMTKRIANYFANVRIFKKKAREWYWEDFKENGGIILWLFIIVFLATVAVCVFGFVKFGVWYHTK